VSQPSCSAIRSQLRATGGSVDSSMPWLWPSRVRFASVCSVDGSDGPLASGREQVCSVVLARQRLAASAAVM